MGSRRVQTQLGFRRDTEEQRVFRAATGLIQHSLKRPGEAVMLERGCGSVAGFKARMAGILALLGLLTANQELSSTESADIW